MSSTKTSDMVLVAEERIQKELRAKHNTLSEARDILRSAAHNYKMDAIAAADGKAKTLAQIATEKIGAYITGAFWVDKDSCQPICWDDDNFRVKVKSMSGSLWMSLPLTALPTKLSAAIRKAKEAEAESIKMAARCDRVWRSITGNTLAKVVRLQLAEARLTKEGVDIESLVASVVKSISEEPANA